MIPADLRGMHHYMRPGNNLQYFIFAHLPTAVCTPFLRNCNLTHMGDGFDVQCIGGQLLWKSVAMGHCTLKGTQAWEFFWLRFWILYYFIVSYVKILRFCKRNFLIGSVLEEVRFFRVVLGLRGMNKIFELGQKNIYLFFFIYEPFIWANASFFEIRSINGAMDGFMCRSWAKMSKFILLSLRLSGIEFSLVWD